MRVRLCFLLVFAASVLLVGAAKVDEPKIELRVAKYDEMGKTIKSFEGKIVIVDFWADT
jgi:hypothetical protein